MRKVFRGARPSACQGQGILVFRNVLRACWMDGSLSRLRARSFCTGLSAVVGGVFGAGSGICAGWCAAGVGGRGGGLVLTRF